MKRQSINKLILRIRICVAALIAVIISAFLFSFTVNKAGEEFLKQLGISKTNADSKITNSILGGYLDAYELRNAKNIATGNRSAVALDLLNYTKQHVSSSAFRKEYNALRESYKPQPASVQTPAELRNDMIARLKKAVSENEATLKKTDASLKPIFEQTLAAAKEELKKAEDPNNKMLKNYEKNYPGMVKQMEENYQYQLKEWEKKYPESPTPFIKQRLLQFLDETNDIDFSAELKVKNNQKVFVNPAYERKSNRWKMAFRAGKEVVTTSRKFVQDWLVEIK